MYKRMHQWFNWIMLVSGASLLGMPWYIRDDTTVGGFGNVGFNTSCQQYWANGIQDAIDECYIFDCEEPWAGGAFDPCGTNPLLTDCANTVTTDTTTTGTDTNTDTDTNTNQ